MTLAERLSEYIYACFTGIWIQTHEDQDALAEIRGLCHDENWRLATWDIEQGLSIVGPKATEQGGAGDPQPRAGLVEADVVVAVAHIAPVAGEPHVTPPPREGQRIGRPERRGQELERRRRTQ